MSQLADGADIPEGVALPPLPADSSMSWKDVSKATFSDGMKMLEEIENPAQTEVESPVEPTAQAVDNLPPVQQEMGELDPDKDGDKLVWVKEGDKKVLKPFKDVSSSYLRQSDYTRKTQTLAQEKQQFEQQRQAEQARIQEFQALQKWQADVKTMLADRNQVAQLLQYLSPAQQEQPQDDPNQIVTVAQLRQAQVQMQQQYERQMQQIREAQTQAIEESAKKQRFEAEVAQHKNQLDPIFKQALLDNPILSKIPNMEDTLRYQVFQLQPKTLQEAKEAVGIIVGGIVEDLRDQFTQSNKQQIVAKAKLSKAQIEPPGGTGPQIQPSQPKDLLKGHGRGLDSDKLMKAGLAMLD
jgi:hypothetical protein